MKIIDKIPKDIQKLGVSLYDYESKKQYTEVQTAANKLKINRQMVRWPQIRFLAGYIRTNYGDVDFGICHGSRRGREQANFSKALPNNPNIIGTEISDTATQFPNTVQWDFTEVNKDWDEKADFVYSNSWDHSRDPKRTFSAWGQSLKPGGLMILHHGDGYGPTTTTEMDPFGASQPALIQIVEWATTKKVTFVEKIQQENTASNDRRQIEAMVFKRTE